MIIKLALKVFYKSPMGMVNKSNYYYFENDETHGPYSIDSILKLINKDTFVFKEDNENKDNDWKKATEFPEFKVFLEEKKGILSDPVRPSNGKKKGNNKSIFIIFSVVALLIFFYFNKSNSTENVATEDTNGKSQILDEIDSTIQEPKDTSQILVQSPINDSLIKSETSEMDHLQPNNVKAPVTDSKTVHRTVPKPVETSNNQKFNQLIDDCKGYSGLVLADKIVYELKPIKDKSKTEATKLDIYHQLCKKVYLELLNLDIKSNKIKICNFRKIVELELENSNSPIEKKDIKAFKNKCEASNN